MSATIIPSDFPNEHRLGDALLFRALLGNPGKSTFARYLQTGLIPPPDKKLVLRAPVSWSPRKMCRTGQQIIPWSHRMAGYTQRAFNEAQGQAP